MSMEEPAERRGEEVESFEAQAASVPAAGAREDWPLRELSFEFDPASGQVVAYEHRGVGPAVSGTEADCHRGPAVLRNRLGRWRHGPA